MISLWNLNRIVKLLRDTCHYEFLECFEVVSLLVGVELEEAVSVDRIVNHAIWRQTTKLHDLKHLIVIVLSRKDGRLDEQFNGSAA